MERRHFLKFAAGFVIGGMALNEAARAAPLPQPLSGPENIPDSGIQPEPAVASQDDIDQLSPEQVRWGRGRRRGWGFRRGWGRRRWRRRHWGWRRRPRPWGWRRRRWRRRYFL